MKRILILSVKVVVVLILICGRILAQPPAKIEHYSTEDGLSHDVITCMFQDNQGFMWFGTWNGINRFDGHQFRSFTSAPGDRSMVKNNRIDQIFEDKANHLWIKSYDGQIYRFDKGTEQFTPLSVIIGLKKKILFDRILSTEGGMLWASTVNNGLLAVVDVSSEKSKYYTYAKSNINTDRLPSDTISFFAKDGDSRFWVGTPKGLVRLSKNLSGRYSAVQIKFRGRLPDHFSAAAVGSGSIYFGTATGDLVELDKQLNKYTRFVTNGGKINALLQSRNQAKVYLSTGLGQLIAFDNRTKKYKRAVNNSAQALYSIFEDSKGDLWLEPEKKGVVRYDIHTGELETYSQKNDAFNVVPRNHFKVFEDRNGTIWSVLRDGGFGYFDDETSKFRYFYNEPGSASSRFSNLVAVAFYDRSGVMWLHTDQRGLDKVIFTPNDFNQHLVTETGVFKSENEIRGLMCDSKNRLWVGAKSGKLYIYDQGRPVNIHFEGIPKGGIGAVYTIFQDPDRCIWMGTKENGLFMAQPLDEQETNYRLSHFVHHPKDPLSISSNQIYSIVADSLHRIWVGTFDKGLNMFVPGRQENVFVRFYDGMNGYPNGYHKIRHLALDGNGRLWIASTDGLVVGNILKKEGVKFRTYSKLPGDIHSLGNNDVQYIFQGHDGRMWLATSGGGLNLAQQSAGTDSLTFKIFSTNEGLASNYILSCNEDRNHQLWVATKSSLSRFDPAKLKFDNFNSYDGLPSNGFSEASCTITPDGKLFFGTIKGLLSFDPSSIKYHPIHSNVVFTGLYINNEVIRPGNDQSILKYDIDKSPALRLSHNQNTIGIDYAILDFRSGDRQNYLYRLKGFDSTWVDNKNQRRTTYTNLPPGDYEFEVKSPDRDNYINVPQRKLAITILPPWWKTWWAYVIYSCLFFVAAFFARKITLTVLKLRQKIAVDQKMTALKMAFFTNVSHELRTPLTLILNPTEEVLKNEPLSEQGKLYLSIVRRNADRMVRFVNQLLDLRKAQSGQERLRLSKVELGTFIKDIMGYFDQAATASNMEMKLSGDASITMLLDIDKMETVIYNLLGNSFKFSPQGSVIEVMIKSEPATGVIIEVLDQGPGVPEEDLESIFQLYHESEALATEHLKGTGIGLALAREFVELHGGKISANNRSDLGLSLKIELPFLHDLFPSEEIEDESATPRPAAAESISVGSDRSLDENITKQLVLLVEDNEDMRSFLVNNLSTVYRIQTAVDGVEGLALAGKIQPDVILSDIMMPRMDGIQMLNRLKNEQATSHIPVILLSAKSAIESQVTALSYGADYYISKPFDNALLFAAIANILLQRKKLVERLVSGQKIVDLSPGQIVVTSKDEVFLQKVIDIVNQKMSDPEFNIDAVAETVNMARATFFKKFKSLTQQAPVEFVRDMRLKVAKQYLDSGAGNISEVSYTVGFGSAKYFSTCFKAMYGLSPSDYLKTIKPKTK
jgi:signal transduction histidine kinase/ligand-binding sensor domain-containing protein/DNA-binding response OmpR family regulator